MSPSVDQPRGWREPAVSRGRCGIEFLAALEVDGSDLALRQLLAVLAHDVHLAVDRHAHRAFVPEPHRTVAGIAGCCLPFRRSTRGSPDHHSIIVRLTGIGHGAAAWMTHSSEDTSYRSRTSSGSLSRRTNIVGTTCVCVTRMTLDELEEALGVEVLHDHDRRAERHRRHREPQRCGVVHRRRRQVDLRVVHPEQHSQHRRDGVSRVSSGTRSSPAARPSAVRSCQRSRACRHRRSAPPMARRAAPSGQLVRLVAGYGAVEHQAHSTPGVVSTSSAA